MSKFQALIVDDERQVRHATARALAALGFECKLAGDGRDALELVRHTKFHLVVTDLKMPDVNGHRLATELLKLEDRPIITVLTGIDEPKLAGDLTARGVERVFSKPVDYAEFATGLLSLVQLRESSLGAGGSRKLEGARAVNGTDILASVTPQTDREPSKCDSQSARHGNTERSASPLAGVTHSITASADCDVAAANCVGQSNSGNYLSNAFSTKIDAELQRTKKALLDLQRTVAAGQNLSYFCLAIALAAGLVGGLILGWLGAQLSSQPTVFK